MTLHKIPKHVSEAQKKLLKMSNAVKAMIPHNTMPLRDFLGCKLPTKSCTVSEFSGFAIVLHTCVHVRKLVCGNEI